MKSELVYLSLGSNLGDREANLAGAITIFGMDNHISTIKSASFYESPFLGEGDQPEYLNTVIEFSTDLSPFDLFERTCKIEQMMGRPEKREKNVARSLDIDILCFGDSVMETEKLTIPHPRLAFRKFVLVPFVELAPDFEVPGVNLSVSSLLHVCSDSSVVSKHSLESRA